MSSRFEIPALHLPPALPGRELLHSMIATTVVCSEALVLGSFVIFGPRSRSLHEAATRFWTRSVLYLSGVDLEVEGAGALDPAGRYVFISNHQSHLDVPCVLNAVPNPTRFVAKRSLFKVPVFGPAIRALGTVGIDRHDRADAVRKLQQAQQDVGRDFSLHFFAEGTRSTDGRLLPFKKGGVATAMALGVPVVPMAISGTRALCPKGAWRVRPGRVCIDILDPLTPGSDTPEERNRVTAQVREAIARRLAERGEPVEEPASPKGVVRGS